MDALIDALSRQLEREPHNWLVRAQLAELYESQGEHPAAVQTIVQAPGLPVDRVHLALGSRLLAGTRPDLAMEYMQRLSRPGMAAPLSFTTDARVAEEPPETGGSSTVTAVRSMAPPPGSAAEVIEARERVPTTAFNPQSFLMAPAAVPPPEEAPPMMPAEEILPELYDLSPPPRRRFGGGVLATSVMLHAALLLAAAFWVIYTITPAPKDKLDFISERPSVSANHKAAEHDVKLAKRKSMGAPPNARRIATTAASKVSIPDSPASSVSDYTPGVMGGGIGMGFGGFGSGSGPGSGFGTGRGGGKIKFFGFEGDATNIILVIDTSGSMLTNAGGESGISKLREEINRTINSLGALSLFNIITFGQQADACFLRSVRATPDNKARAIKFMAGYYGGGGFGRTRTEKLVADNQPTNVEQAEIEGVKFTPLLVDGVKGLEGTTGGSRMDLALVAAMERDAATIFLLSDGQPNPARDGKLLDKDDLIKLIKDNYDRMYKRKPLVINTIYTNTDKSEEDFMKKISRGFSGKHKDVKLE